MLHMTRRFRWTYSPCFKKYDTTKMQNSFMSISADILPPAAVTQALIKGTNEYLLNSSD